MQRTNVVFGLIGAFLFSSDAALAQTEVGTAQFEVASVRISTPNSDGRGCGAASMTLDSGQIQIRCAPLVALLELAYGIPWRQVVLPATRTPVLDIAAKFPDNTSAEKVPEMMRALLEDRLKLAVHLETRRQSVDIIVRHGKLKIQEASPEPDVAPGCSPEPNGIRALNGVITRSAMLPNGFRAEFNPRIGMFRQSAAPNLIHWDFSNATLQGVADVMAESLGLPVLDGTGLKGRYRLTLDISLAAFRPLSAPQNNTELEAKLLVNSNDLGEALDSALRRIGLRLVTRMDAVELLIVDHVESVPAEN